MPHLSPPRPSPTLPGLLLTVVLGLAAAACQDAAGPPPYMEAGVVDFDYIGPASTGSFTADGRCYWAPGYPTADTACAVAMDRGDTILIRGSLHPRTAKWQQMNLQFPSDGQCVDTASCRIALDYLNRGGTVLQQLRSRDADVTVLETADGRIRGTFTGLLYRVGGLDSDTMRIANGTFDVPVGP